MQKKGRKNAKPVFCERTIILSKPLLLSSRFRARASICSSNIHTHYANIFHDSQSAESRKLLCARNGRVSIRWVGDVCGCVLSVRANIAAAHCVVFHIDVRAMRTRKFALPQGICTQARMGDWLRGFALSFAGKTTRIVRRTGQQAAAASSRPRNLVAFRKWFERRAETTQGIRCGMLRVLCNERAKHAEYSC